MVLRIGSIGYGDIAQRRHFPQLRELAGRAELVAIAGRDGSRMAACAARFGVSRVYADPEAMLADPGIDAVLVLTPPDSHARFAEAAIKAGKHVMVEKPLVPSLAEAERLREAVRAGGSVTFYPLPHVATAEHALVARLVAAGCVGAVTSVENHRGHRGPTHAAWFYDRSLAGGGVLIDLGIYQLTAMATLFGPAVSMTAACATRFATRVMDDGTVVRPDVEDIALLTLMLADRTAISVNVNWTSAPPHVATRARVVAFGREGTLYFGSNDGFVHVHRPDGDHRALPEGAEAAPFDGLPCQRVAYAVAGGPPSIVEAFVKRIEEGDRSTRALDIQLHVMDIIAAAYDPENGGRAVVLPRRW